MDAVARLQHVRQVERIFQVDRIMTDMVQRYRLGKGMRVRDDDVELARLERLDDAFALLERRTPIDRLRLDAPGEKLRPELVDRMDEHAPDDGRLALIMQVGDELHPGTELPCRRHAAQQFDLRAVERDWRRVLLSGEGEAGCLLLSIHLLEVECPQQELRAGRGLQEADVHAERVPQVLAMDEVDDRLLGVVRLHVVLDVRLRLRHLELVLRRPPEERQQLRVDFLDAGRGRILQLARLEVEEALVVLPVQDVQEVIDVLVGVRYRRTGQDVFIRSQRRETLRDLGPFALHPLDFMDLVEDEHRASVDDVAEHALESSERLIVDEDEVERVPTETKLTDRLVRVMDVEKA